MPGQPNIPGVLVFNVMDLQVVEPNPTEIWAPKTIVATTEDFELRVSFNGSGFVWGHLKREAAPFTISYFAEGIGGPPVDEKTIAEKTGQLTNDDEYNILCPVLHPHLHAGVYRIACVITFPTMPGLTGFFENLVIQVYEP